MALEKDVQIQLKGGITAGVLIQPEEQGTWPGIIWITDIGGIREAQKRAAGRLAAEGYVVLMPNVFYRVAEPPVIDVSLRSNPDAFAKRIGELTGPLTSEAIARDADGYVDFFLQRPELRKSPRQLGVVGFCAGGGFALRLAAERPDQVAACASLHGGHLFTQAESSPHHVLPRVKGRLYFGHATKDKSMPPEAIAEFEKALAKWGGQWASETYEGALHGWTTLDHPAYNPEQAERAYGKIKQLFAETLQARSSVTA
jgi:carboxymethylenebutenolidase